MPEAGRAVRGVRRIVLEAVLADLTELLSRDRATLSALVALTVEASPALIEAGMPTTAQDGTARISAISLLNYIVGGLIGVDCPIGYKTTSGGVIVAFGTLTRD